ncbi:MAG: ABC transporter ATP-binding protein [Desulfovibrionales bacterium]
MSAPAVEINLHQVSKQFGPHSVVHQASFRVGAGEFLVVLGPSGCGKSTLLRLIAGLESVNEGRIFFGNKDVTLFSPTERKVSMVFQSYALFPHLTVAENITFGLDIRRTPKQEVRKRLASTAELLGLSELLPRKPAALSGGQRQRVALGRAIISRRPVCLMDEPLSNLDAKLRGEMRREIRVLQKRLGITMIYVTHDQVEAMTMADRIVLMQDGQIKEYGTPEELYEKPQILFSAQFIGTPPMNLMPLEDSGNGQPGAVVKGTRHVVLQGISGQGLLLGVRPEKMGFCSQGLPAQVVALEYMGADCLASCRVGDGLALVRTDGRNAPAEGSSVHLCWESDDIHIFEADSGRRREIGFETNSAA